MDVDAARRARAAPSSTNVCYRCRGVGHFARDCPHGHDVRAVDTADWTDEQWDFMEQELALRRDMKELQEKEEEDFVEGRE